LKKSIAIRVIKTQITMLSDVFSYVSSNFAFEGILSRLFAKLFLITT